MGNRMKSTVKRYITGVTLIELLVWMTVLTVVTSTSVPMMQRLLASERLTANANQVLAMIHMARAEGAYRSPMLICSGQGGCDSFRQPDDRLVLIADLNNNRALDSGDETLSELALPDGMTVQWRSFRNHPWLRINRFGVAYYQNGHFLLCYRGQARKVILNFQAKARVSHPSSLVNCPAQP